MDAEYCKTIYWNKTQFPVWKIRFDIIGTLFSFAL